MSENKFLPICKKDMEERGWEQLDFVYISGDAYVDHPAWMGKGIEWYVEEQISAGMEAVLR